MLASLLNIITVGNAFMIPDRIGSEYPPIIQEDTVVSALEKQSQMDATIVDKKSEAC